MGLFSRRRRRAEESHDESIAAPAAGPDDPAADREEPDLPLTAFDALVAREMTRISAPGTWWNGGERVAIARDARALMVGAPLSGILPPPVAEATERVATAAATIRPADLARWRDAGLHPLPYVELVGVVARLAAIDVAAFGIGRHLPDLNEPMPGGPSRIETDGAEITTGWVPTIGPATAASSLSAVPAERDAMADLDAVLYASAEQLLDLTLTRDGLTRSQIELVAARTALLDDCVGSLLRHVAMLRASVATAGAELDPRPIVTGLGDTGVAAGTELMAFTDAIVLRDVDEYHEARAALVAEVGPHGADRAAMVAGRLAMTDRALDAVGAPVDEGDDALAAEMEVAIPPHRRTGP